MPAKLHVSSANLTIAALLLFASGALALQTQEAPAGAEPYRVGEEVTRPEKISGAPPVYTEIARKSGVEGTVIVEAIIDEHGDVTHTRILKGLPMGLDRAALKAVQTWKFKPARLEGQPVRVYYTLTVNFQVEGDGVSTFGPMFAKFLERNIEFAQILEARRYQEAAGLLQSWAAERPADSEIQLARCYLLLEQGQLKEAWQEAQAYRGPEPFEILFRVGWAAWRQVTGDKILSAKARAEIIEIGLQAETLAMKAREDPWAASTKGALFLEKAKLATDPEERQALAAEAEELRRLAGALQSEASPGPPPQP